MSLVHTVEYVAVMEKAFSSLFNASLTKHYTNRCCEDNIEFIDDHNVAKNYCKPLQAPEDMLGTRIIMNKNLFVTHEEITKVNFQTNNHTSIVSNLSELSLLSISFTMAFCIFLFYCIYFYFYFINYYIIVSNISI